MVHQILSFQKTFSCLIQLFQMHGNLLVVPMTVLLWWTEKRTEGRNRLSPLIKEAVVFGIGISIPGLLLFRADSAVYSTDQEFVDQVWSRVQDANSRAEGFSQISKEMIISWSTTVELPSTNKELHQTSPDLPWICRDNWSSVRKTGLSWWWGLYSSQKSRGRVTKVG